MALNKWTDEDQEKPKKSRYYDLCLLDLGDKIVTGWWTGFRWDGFKYNKQPVKKWKLVDHEEFI